MGKIVREIGRLKEKNAIILAHNYQRGDVQDIADYTGDSLGVNMKASETDADIVVFLLSDSWLRLFPYSTLTKKFFYLTDMPVS